MAAEQEEKRVKLPEELRGGVYANNMLVGHSQEEFIMDFILVAPPEGTVTARAIISPRHMKRIISALQTNMKRYEDAFGKIEAAEEPKKIIGLQSPGGVH